VDDTFTVADGQELRIVAIESAIGRELKDAGFTAIFFVEPPRARSSRRGVAVRGNAPFGSYQCVYIARYLAP
jgi:hypothetical protein